MTKPLQSQGICLEVGRYLIVGGLNTAIGLAVILILKLGFNVDLIVANAVGYAVGLVVSFIGNRNWTFGMRGTRVWRTLPGFVVVVAISFATSILLMNALMSAGMSYIPSQLAGVLVYSTLFFLGLKYLVFHS